MLADSSIVVNQALGSWKDNLSQRAEAIDEWVNRIINQTKGEWNMENCEICAKKSDLELHHIAGRKHDERVIPVCEGCHQKLSDEQKQWDARWWIPSQPEILKEAFFLLGLRDLLRLKAEKTSDTIYRDLADTLTEDISKRLRA